MNKTKSKRLFEEALSYCEKNFKDEIEWAKGVSPDTFKRMTARKFLEEYCYVVYASGFRASIIKAKFPRLRKAFKNFELESLVRMRSLSKVLTVFNNERKAGFFLKGSKAIIDEGFPNFKRRLEKEGISVLKALPGIGPITKYHLAKNIGFIDEAKPDRNLVLAANSCNASVDELVRFLSVEYGMSRHAVDVVLWRYVAENKPALRND